MKRKQLLMKTLLAVAGLTSALGASAYDTPSGYKVGTVYVGHEENNQVLAETFANYNLNTDITSISANWSSNVTGTSGYYWAKINNTVKTVGYPATNQATLFTCNKYTATNDGGTTNKTIYSNDGGTTYYTSRDFQTIFNTTGYEITADGTDFLIPSYVNGKCISLQHRDKSEFHLDYTMPAAVYTGKLVFGADFYRIQNANAPIYIQFYDSEDNRVFQIYYNNGSGRQTMYYQVGTSDAVGGAGYSEYRTYRGWGIKNMVFDLDAGTVSYSVDNVHWDGSHSANRRTVSQSAISFGTGKNIKKVRFSMTGGSSKTNYDMFVDNMYLYTLVEGTATTNDLTIIGSKDYEDGYLTNTSSDYVITPNGNLHLEFKNYGSGAYNWNNWIALFNNADKSSNLAYIRADAWELVSSSNTGITTSSNYWDAFESDMFGSSVAIDITRTGGTVNMLATITTTADETLTLTFNKAIGTASENIVFRLSEEAACLVIDNTKTSVSKTITSAGWATYCSPYALDLENATNLTDAYIVTGGADGVLSKTSVKGGTVPANTGLLLKGTEGSAVEVTIPVVASSATNVSANKLTGVTANTEIAANAGYVLMASPSLGFYQNANAFTVGANTAYLPAGFDGGSARSFFSFGSDATGIGSAKSEEIKVKSYFNLKGQRVNQPTKGLYIVNGKKVVIK